MDKKCVVSVVSVVSRLLRDSSGSAVSSFVSSAYSRSMARIGGRPRFSPGFPVEFGGFGELHAPFFTEGARAASSCAAWQEIRIRDPGS